MPLTKNVPVDLNSPCLI